MYNKHKLDFTFSNRCINFREALQKIDKVMNFKQFDGNHYITEDERIFKIDKPKMCYNGDCHNDMNCKFGRLSLQNKIQVLISEMEEQF